MNATTRSAGPDDGSDSFSDEERAAIKERAKELRTAKRSGKADKEAAVLEAISAMPEDDRAIAQRVHEIIRATAPDLAPKLWYGMPAYAKDGKVLCFLQAATKFDTRYATLGFNDVAQLDDGAMWPSAYALTGMGAAEEKAVTDLIRRAVSS